MGPLIAAYFRGRNSVPSEAWLTLLVIIAALYVIFRWRKFGEDSFTWNHTYFKRAVSFGIGVWILSFLATLPPEYWQRAALWIAVAIVGILAMDYWGGEGIFPAATITMLMILVGVAAMPLPRAIGHFIYGSLLTVDTGPRPASRTAESHPGANLPPALAGKERTLVLPLPSGWESIPGKISSTYRSSRPGAGFFQLSLHPPLEGKIDGARVEKELDSLLTEMKSDMPFGKRLELGHLTAKNGYLAYARYQSDEHGTLGFWLLPGESMVFATYVDGGSSASPADLREAQKALQNAEFK